MDPFLARLASLVGVQPQGAPAPEVPQPVPGAAPGWVDKGDSWSYGGIDIPKAWMAHSPADPGFGTPDTQAALFQPDAVSGAGQAVPRVDALTGAGQGVTKPAQVSGAAPVVPTHGSAAGAPPPGQGNAAPAAPASVPGGAPTAGISTSPTAPQDPGMAAIDAQTALDTKAANMRATGLQGAADENARRLAEEETARAQAAKDAEVQFTALNEEVNAIQNMPISSKLSTGQAIAGGIAAAIGGYLNPMGPNSAVQVIQQAIENQVKEQMANLDKRRQVLQTKIGLAKDKAGADQDRIAAMDLMRANAYDTAIKQIDANLSGLGSEQAQIDGNKAKLALIAERDAARARADQETFKNALELQRVKNDTRQVDIAAGHLALDREKFNAETLKKSMTDPNDPRIIVDPRTGTTTVGMIHGTDTQAEAFKKGLAGRFVLAQKIGDIQRRARAEGSTYQGAGADYFRSEKGRALMGVYNEALADYLHSVSGAVVNNQEVERLKTALPPPESWLKASPEEAWAAFSDNMGKQTTAEGRTLGLDYDFTPMFQSLREDTRSEAEKKAAAAGVGPALDPGIPRGTAEYDKGVYAVAARDVLGPLAQGVPDDVLGTIITSGSTSELTKATGRTFTVPEEQALLSRINERAGALQTQDQSAFQVQKLTRARNLLRQSLGAAADQLTDAQVQQLMGQ